MLKTREILDFRRLKLLPPQRKWLLLLLEAARELRSLICFFE
jgi:hypothetical protein